MLLPFLELRYLIQRTKLLIKFIWICIKKVPEGWGQFNQCIPSLKIDPNDYEDEDQCHDAQVHKWCRWWQNEGPNGSESINANNALPLRHPSRMFELGHPVLMNGDQDLSGLDVKLTDWFDFLSFLLSSRRRFLLTAAAYVKRIIALDPLLVNNSIFWLWLVHVRGDEIVWWWLLFADIEFPFSK